MTSLDTNNLCETFWLDGVACVRGALSRNWIDQLRGAVDEVMADPSDMSRDLADESASNEGGGVGRFYNEIFPARRNEDMWDFIENSPIGEIAAIALNSRFVRYFNDHLLVKEPGTGVETLWHQDLPYFPCDGRKVCSVWVALDQVTQENGAVNYVKGSHLSGMLYTPQNFGTGEPYDTDEFDGLPPDVDADPLSYPTICYELEPGDVTIHHGCTLHGALGNRSLTARRRGYTIRLVGDDVVWRERQYMARGFAALDDGALLEGPGYPVIWP